MDVGTPRGDTMGPERIIPNPNEDLGEQRVPEGLQENMGDWSGEDPEEEGDQQPEEEEDDEEEDQEGYFYQPLNQDPEHGTWAQHGTGGDPSYPEPAEEEAGANIQERLQEMRLHLPDPPVDSDDEDGASAINSQTSIPMDAEHVELVKRTMAGINLPSLGVPPWATQISDEQWKDMVQVTLQSRVNTSGPAAGWE